MATKKTGAKSTVKKTTNKSPAKPVVKKKLKAAVETVASAKLQTVKASPVEQKLSAMMSDTQINTPKAPTSIVKKSSPWWGVMAALLLLIFAGILLYNYNKDFRYNFDKMADSTGIKKMVGKDGTDSKTAPVEKFSMKLTVVYDKADPTQKATIDKYLQNIESNLTNTKTAATWYDKNDAEGKAMIAKLDAKFLPIFTTDESIKKHSQYALFAPAIKTVNGIMVFQSEGIEYLKVPEIGDAKVRGADPKKAKVVIIEYSSLTCGFCKMMDPILNNIAKKYKNEVAIVTKHYDRGGIDSTLAQAVECAGEQGKFDQLTSLIFAKQSDLFAAIQKAPDAGKALDQQLMDLSKGVGANGQKVLACVKSAKYADLVKRQTEEGQSFGVIGTPSMFVNKKFLGGALGDVEMNQMVESEMKK